MKKIILCLSAWFLLVSIYAQQKPIQEQVEAVPANQFSGENLFAAKAVTADKLATLGQYVSNFQLLDIDDLVLNNIAADSIPALEISVPLNGVTATLQLIRSNAVNEQTAFFTRNNNGKTPVTYKQGAYYYGIIKDQPNTLVAMSFFDHDIIGVISDNTGNYVLGKSHTPDSQSKEYILYHEKDLLMENNMGCGVTEEMTTLPVIPQEQVQMAGSCNKAVGVYIETDYDVYDEQGSTVANVLNFVTGLFNITATIYGNESINTFISEVNVWTVPDPYTSALNINEMLTLFGNEMSGGFNGDLAHLFSTRNLGKGIAWVDVLCGSNQYKTAVSTSLDNTTPGFPEYSWNANVITHEMGHNLGSWHTHDCVWNGNNTAIDGCGPVAGYSPQIGGCVNAALPPPNGGTIMSYCHLLDIGINLNLGFGPQPGDLIRNRVYNAACLSEICCPAHLIVTQDVSGGNTDYREAGQTLTATNTIFNNATAVYHAGQQVVLQPDFHAQNGAVFHAYVEGCSGVFQAKMQTQDIKTKDHQVYNTSNDEVPFENDLEDDISDREFAVYPNPFTAIVNFKYTVDRAESPVLLKIYTLTGEDIATLVQQQRSDKGIFHVQWNGNGLPEGMYLYRLEIGNAVKTGKIVLKR